ncbi:2-isopropylmalate synthase [Nonomuraea roseoviolacea subsp. carminata]|uniref:2-isopropylmalate synthase n=2 Tax=Nonomuraea TaxID=83681 RepID=A0ABT1K2Q9_9ACTN|nr:2-isopropylmalate synthase [Nonomuraea roseoviolacea subsp. carminata]
MSAPFPTLRTPSGPIPAGQPHWNPQRPGSMPSHRYRPVHERVDVPAHDRRWPSRTVTAAPLWVPVDLRDGNQALADPMDPDRKRRMFELFLAMGFKEIEVGYPSASRTDFDFVRLLAERDLVPDDVTPVVFTAARPDLIERTYASIEGLPRAVVHMYTSTAPTWREVVLGQERDDLRAFITRAAGHVARLGEGRPGVRFEFSPEVFNLTEPDYVLEICNGLSALWDASPDRPVIHNLPATVEVATPNVYADQIEYMHRHLDRRDGVILSVHPHNDRGTGVACAELAVLAGAQRVEGCLFGNGERTGNVDLVTLALNLHAQGVDPMIDLSDIDVVRATVEHCNRIPVHPRHPYGGDLVYTAFSGTHQDAIKKGFAHHERRAAELGVTPDRAPWAVPYLPIDPRDVGRDYEAVIRVNSQSGKGGVAYVLGVEHGLDLPRGLQIDFSRAVQDEAELSGGEVTGERLWELFRAAYVGRTGPVELLRWKVDDAGGEHAFTGDFAVTGAGERRGEGTGVGPLAALTAALRGLGHDVEIVGYTEHAVPASGRAAAGEESLAAAYVECRVAGVTAWGVGLAASVLTAAVDAVVSAVNHALSRD